MDDDFGLLRARVALRGLVASLEATAQLAAAPATDTLPPSRAEVARKASVRLVLTRQAFDEAQPRSRAQRELLGVMRATFDRLEAAFRAFEPASPKSAAASALADAVASAKADASRWDG